MKNRHSIQKYLLKNMIFVTCLVSVSVVMAKANDWSAVTGAAKLTMFMSDLKAERVLPNGEISRGEYRVDGTGVLYSWGAEIPRTWEVKGENQICVAAERKRLCYTLEQNRQDSTRYRVQGVDSDVVTEIKITGEKTTVESASKSVDAEGGAATPSAAELAAELSNPNTAVATLTFKNQFRWFEGDLPEANNQSSYTLLFQPGLPFVFDSGDKILWRPAVPIIVNQPTFDSASGGFGGESGLGDIAFDLAYAPKLEDKSLLFALGAITSLPTATNDLGSGQWTLGPELLIGKMAPKWVLGLFPNHQWDVGGWTENTINLTSIQAFYTYLPGGGWSVGTGPTMTYDWESEQWTVPLQANVGKTVVWNGRPWKLGFEVNYYVERADSFGPEWMVSFNIAPVVKNGLASLFGL